MDYELDGNGSVEFDIIKTGSTVSDPLTLTRNVGVKIIEEFTGVKKTTWTTVIDTNAADENGDFQLADAAETSQRPLNQYVLLGTYSAAIATKANIGSVPSTATSAGVPGTIAYNTTHLYICVASNTWRRVSIDAW